MLYIMTEDSHSARVFWEIAANTFRENENYKVLPFLNNNNLIMSGNTSLWDQLLNFVNNNTDANAELFIIFDNIEGSYNFNTRTFIKNAVNICRLNNITLKMTDYYCFEELYLSYSELKRLNKDNRDIVINAVDFVRNCLLNGVNYFDIRFKPVAYFINFYKKDSGKNREHFANALLISITELLDGRFRIIKSGNSILADSMCDLTKIFNYEKHNKR